MSFDWSSLVLFAQEAAAPAGEASGNPLFQMLPPLFGVGFLFVFLIWMPERKKQQQHNELVANLKKNDKVITTSGIYASVYSVNKEKDEMVLRIDEDKDVKIRISPRMIAHVIVPPTANKETKEEA